MTSSTPVANPQEAHPSPAPAEAVAAALHDGKTHVLLAASGSVATIKLPLITTALATTHPNLSIRIILTKSAAAFLAGQSPEQPTLGSLAALPNVAAVHLDADEWVQPWTRGARILHVELRRWAHLLAIVPMSANLLAKVTGGLCDDLLTCVVRAWDVGGGLDGRRRCILVAPAMNSFMWTHPLTARQIKVLDAEWDWFEVLWPQVKGLACGDVGVGGMCDWREIVGVIERRLGLTGLERMASAEVPQ